MEKVYSQIAAMEMRFIKQQIEDAMTHPQDLENKLLKDIAEYAEQCASEWERSAE